MAKPKWYSRFTGPNFLAGMSVLFIRSYVDFSEEENMLYLRIAAGMVISAMMLVMAFIFTKAKWGPESATTIFVKNSQLYPDMFGLDPPGAETKFEVSVAEYDTIALWTLAKKIVMTCTIAGAVHLYYEAPVPLMMVCVSQPAQIFKHNLFKIHILGKNTKLVRALRRPWPAPPVNIPFGKSGFFAKQLQEYRAEMDAAWNGDVQAAAATTGGKKSKKKQK